jgi:Cof subfamily protein (haloacid dehalogenase superfamily)/HAD superfamily hydrolase (TIGR01509 family)
MAIKLLIADVDGTLITSKKALTRATCEAVARLRAGGVDFTVTSGRPPRGMASLVKPLQLTAPLAGFNGGLYVKPDLKTVIAQRTIAPAAAKQVVDYFLRAGTDVWVYRGDEWFLRKVEAFRVPEERFNVQFEPTVTRDLYGLLDAAIKIVGVSEDQALLTRCEAELAERLGAEASPARSHRNYLDVTHPEAHKGMVVRDAARMLGLPLEQIAAIGDMPNDITMLSAAGMGIAMGNAGAEVRRAARHVTKSNDEEGFAYAADTFILGEPGLARTKLGIPRSARAVILGLDGVLAQTGNLHGRAWKRLTDHYLRERARNLGQPFIPFDAVRDWSFHFDGKTPADGVRSFLASREIDLPESTVRALVERKGEILLEMLPREPVETFEGSVQYLQAARAAGLRTAAVSSTRQCGDILKSAGLADLFDQCVAGEAGSNGYLAAAQALGVAPEHAVVFEDELPGIATARASHFGYIVGVDRVGRAAELRRSGADVVVPDLAFLITSDHAATGGRTERIGS